MSSAHVIDPSELEFGSHIYRRLNGLKSLVGYHHGIVSFVHGDKDVQKIRVIEMTSLGGIRTNSLTAFLHGWDCRLVWYKTSKTTHFFHGSGTCHTERSSTNEQILKRIADVLVLKTTVYQNKELYGLTGMNCEEFAVWIKTGLYKGMEMSQIINADIKRVSVGAMALNGSAWVSRFGKTIATKAAAKAAARAALLTADDAVAAAGTTAVETTKAGLSAAAVGLGIGIPVAVELGITAYAFYRCKTDYSYTKVDRNRDVGRGWIVATAVTIISLSCVTPLGWFVLLPALAVGLGLSYALQRFGVFDKPHKLKLYYDYGLNKESTVQELRKVRRGIRRQMRDEKLHPDTWEEDMSHDDKKKRYDKYLWFSKIMELLNEDIRRGYVTFKAEVEEDDNDNLSSRKQIEYSTAK